MSHLKDSHLQNSELQRTLRELRAENVLYILPGLWLASFAFYAAGGGADRPLGLLACVMSFALAVIVGVLHRTRPTASSWILIIGCAVMVLYLARIIKLEAALCSLSIPVGIAMLATNPVGGLGTALVLTVLLFLAPMGIHASAPGLVVATTVSMWSTVVLMWLAERPLLTSLRWSWSTSEQSSRLLEESRDQRVRFKQALRDLANANRELARLTAVSEGFRRMAEDANRAKQQFVANVSHELRTPLHMVVGFVEMIMQAPQSYGGSIPTSLLADLDVVLRNARHLTALIDDVLDLSQVDIGRMSLTKERVAIGEIIEEAVTAIYPLYRTKDLYLTTDIRDNPTLSCDRTRIRETLLNLLSNAGRFTERGGVFVECRCERGEAVVKVTDTGPGISAADRDRLFKPFEQLDSSTRRRHGGTGLGLALSKQFVELHGGRLWVESEKGQGSSFYFSLPLQPLAEPESAATRWLNEEWGYRAHIARQSIATSKVRRRALVVEEGNLLQRLLTRYAADIDVRSVYTLAEAKRALAHDPAQTLIINSASVGETLGCLGEAELPQGAGVIVLSLPTTASAAKELGADGYLIKPVSQRDLLRALDSLRLKSGTVLVVEDESDAQRLLRRMLVSAGRNYRVLRASDGEQALAVLRQQTPDVVLLDLVMENMDGFRFLEAKNTDAALRDIPVFVVSARDASGQPLVSSSLAMSRIGGLSLREVLTSIDALTRILDASLYGHQARPASPDG